MDLKEMLKRGDSDQMIIDYMTARYGDFVLGNLVRDRLDVPEPERARRRVRCRGPSSRGQDRIFIAMPLQVGASAEVLTWSNEQYQDDGPWNRVGGSWSTDPAANRGSGNRRVAPPRQVVASARGRRSLGRIILNMTDTPAQSSSIREFPLSRLLRATDPGAPSGNDHDRDASVPPRVTLLVNHTRTHLSRSLAPLFGWDGLG